MYFKKLNIAGVDYEMETTITGEGAPEPSVAGNVGQLYMDTLTGQMYKCLGKESDNDEGYIYQWAEAGGIRNTNTNGIIRLWAGTQAEYDATTKSNDTIYLIDIL